MVFYKQLICLMWKYHEIELNTCSTQEPSVIMDSAKQGLLLGHRAFISCCMVKNTFFFFFCCHILGRALDTSSVDKSLPAGIGDC